MILTNSYGHCEWLGNTFQQSTKISRETSRLRNSQSKSNHKTGVCAIQRCWKYGQQENLRKKMCRSVSKNSPRAQYLCHFFCMACSAVSYLSFKAEWLSPSLLLINIPQMKFSKCNCISMNVQACKTLHTDSQACNKKKFIEQLVQDNKRCMS